MGNMLSVGDLAKRFGASGAQIRYAAATRGIEPLAQVGGRLIFDEAAAVRIGEAMKRVRASKVDIEAAAQARG